MLRSVSQLPAHVSTLKRTLPLAVVLLLIWFGSRLPALDKMPLFVDEGVHLTRASEVWHGHPFWNISDGKIINQWPIALFYPQHAPVFVARMATVLVALLGLAAGFALSRRYFGEMGGLLAAVIWITCPYLFFYERTALIDAETGALGVVVIWASLRLARTGYHRDAILTGTVLALAALFKLTDAPFGLSVLLIVLGVGTIPRRQKIINLALVAVTGLIWFTPPLIYAALHQGFGVVAGWVGVSSGQGFTIGANLGTLWTTLVGYDSTGWLIALCIGLLVLVIMPLTPGSLLRRREYWVLLIAGLVPLTLIVVLGANAMPRHFVSGIPILLTFGSAGLGTLADRLLSALPRPALPKLAVQVAVPVVLAVSLIPFAQTAYTAPGRFVLPPVEQEQYLTGYSAGFGLSAAVLDFPHTIDHVGSPIIGSMYPDSCRLADFYDVWGYTMQCTDAPGLKLIQLALASVPAHDAVYVLAQSPPIGLDAAGLTALPGVTVTRSAAYPRPGETPATASVVLWRLEKR